MKHIMFIMITMGLLGCTKQPVLKVYSLDAPLVGVMHSSQHRSKNIKVIYPQSLKEQITQKMHFSYTSNDRGNYRNSEWSNNISKLLQGTFIEVLDSSTLFKAVLSDLSTVKENYRLESMIYAFEHQVRATESHAVISIQFTLISADTGRLLKSKRFSYREVTPTVDAQGYASATNVAMGRLNRELLGWLR